MGTIKVYDGVIGRSLREAANIAGTTQAEVLGCLIALWQWGMDNADEDGVVNHSGRKDVVRCLSAVSDDLAAEVADALFKTGYVQEKDQSIILDGWKTQQLWHYREDAARKRDSERKRLERSKKAEPTVKPVEEAPVKQPDPQEEEAPVEAKRKKPKKHYAEFVLMTKDEYGKLCEQYGEPLTQKAIEILNQYIGSTGKRYKSHYMTLIGWPIKEACKRNPDEFRKFKEENASSEQSENPYQEYMG